MKNLLIAFLSCVMSASAFAQITLIDEYPSLSDAVYIDDGMLKIFVHQPQDDFFTLYNLDNSVYRVVQLPEDGIGYSLIQFLFITRQLFDCDTTDVEYIAYRYQSDGPSNATFSVTVMEEDGTQLAYYPQNFIINHNNPQYVGHAPAIQNAPGGAVMGISQGLYADTSPKAYYRLCGQLPAPYREDLGGSTGIAEEPGGIEVNGVSLAPNPASSDVRITYSLPDNVRFADLRVFDMNGKLLETMKVGNAFDHVMLNVRTFAPGTYLINILLDDGRIVNEKFVKVAN